MTKELSFDYYQNQLGLQQLQEDLNDLFAKKRGKFISSSELNEVITGEKRPIYFNGDRLTGAIMPLPANIATLLK